MFETAVVKVQTRARKRYPLLIASVTAHVAIILAIVAASLASVKMPANAPNQMVLPVFDRVPPPLGSPDARPTVKPPQPAAQPQVQRAPVAQTAPSVIPQTVQPVPTSSSASSDTGPDTGTGEPGPIGVPWGVKDSIGPIDGPPVASEPVQEGPLVAGVGDVKAPIVLKRVQPPYPRAALMARMNGFVIVECIIDRTGQVRDARVLKSSSGLFEQAALDAVQQWQFAPGSLHGRPVDTIFNLTVTFTISR